MEKCLSDRSISSSPDSVNQEHSPVFISSSHKVSLEINSSPSSPATNDSTNESYEAFSFHPSSYTENEDYDQPLDMSRKRTDYTVTSTVDLPSSHQQQLRPSVITCASALLRTQCSLSDSPHNICTIKANCDSNSNDIDDNHCINHLQTNKSNSNELKVSQIGHRKEIVSGSCDPVIDEHFRRSLGKDYQNIFSKSSGNNVSITVDDHFAKALGETWHQLQQSKTTSDSVPSGHASSSIQAQPPPQFLHQPPEILS